MEGFFTPSSSLSNQQEMAIGAECWLNTEQITQQNIICYTTNRSF